MVTDTYMVHIPRWTKPSGEVAGGTTRRMTLVAVLPKGQFADPKLVDKFYGPDAPRSAYGKVKHDRMVFCISDGNYLIMPDAPCNRDLWWLAERVDA